MARDRNLGSDDTKLCDEIESRFQAFKRVDEEIRAIVASLQDLLLRRFGLHQAVSDDSQEGLATDS